MMAFLIEIEFSQLLHLQKYQKILDYTNYEPKGTYHYQLIQIYKVIAEYVLSNGDEDAIKNELEEIQPFLKENKIFETLFMNNILENKKNDVNKYFEKLQLEKDHFKFKKISNECVKTLFESFRNAKNDLAWKKLIHIYCYCGLRWMDININISSRYLLPFETSKIKYLTGFHLYNGHLICVTKMDKSFKISSKSTDVFKKIQKLIQMFHPSKEETIKKSESDTIKSKDEYIDEYIEEISKGLESENLKSLVEKLSTEKETLSFYFGYGCDSFWEIPVYALRFGNLRLIEMEFNVEILSLTVYSQKNFNVNLNVCICPQISNIPNTQEEKKYLENLKFQNYVKKEELKQKLPEAKIIHFSTHCSKENQLKLENNVSFEYHDIPEINPQLVYLACCFGIHSKYHALSGPDRLIHWLIKQGARNIVGSIWPVKDSNSYDIVKSFYDNFFNSKSPSESLKIALSSYRMNCKKEDDVPVFWANYMFIRVLPCAMINEMLTEIQYK
jgi:hypothetical protein